MKARGRYLRTLRRERARLRRARARGNGLLREPALVVKLARSRARTAHDEERTLDVGRFHRRFRELRYSARRHRLTAS